MSRQERRILYVWKAGTRLTCSMGVMQDHLSSPRQSPGLSWVLRQSPTQTAKLDPVFWMSGWLGSH